MTDMEILGAAIAYTNKCIAGAGGLKGANCTIKSIDPITGGNRITFEWEDNEGHTETSTMDVMDGADGQNGAPGADGQDGVSPTISVSTITGGHAVSITDAQGTNTFNVMDGIDGSDGKDGKDGTNGANGTDGVGITSITFKDTDASGNNVYTVNLSNNTSYDITCPKGPAGATGSTGPAGPGVASGGTADQVLVKKSFTDYDTDWKTLTKSDVGLSNVPNVSTNDQEPTFTEASTRNNIASGEKLSVIFGKIQKFFNDLKTVAFTGSYNDLTNKPIIPTSAGGITYDNTTSGLTATDVQGAVDEMHTNFQAGVEDIYDACVAKGSTPASTSLSDVVAAIAAISTGITPSGTKSITSNGTYDVTEYANADVSVPGPVLIGTYTGAQSIDVSSYKRSTDTVNNFIVEYVSMSSNYTNGVRSESATFRAYLKNFNISKSLSDNTLSISAYGYVMIQRNGGNTWVDHTSASVAVSYKVYHV